MRVYPSTLSRCVRSREHTSVSTLFCKNFRGCRALWNSFYLVSRRTDFSPKKIVFLGNFFTAVSSRIWFLTKVSLFDQLNNDLFESTRDQLPVSSHKILSPHFSYSLRRNVFLSRSDINFSSLLVSDSVHELTICDWYWLYP